MGVSQNNKACIWKKGQKRGKRDDEKHSIVNFNGTIYNELENTYICNNLA